MEEKEKVLELGGSLEALMLRRTKRSWTPCREVRESQINARLNSAGDDDDTGSLQSEEAGFWMRRCRSLAWI